MNDQPEVSPLLTVAREAIDFLGGTVATARKFRVKPASVSEWRKRGIPVGRCVELETECRGDQRFTRYQLRPDVFGDAPSPDLREAG